MNFMILANPRSRTKWVAEYLSSYGARVGHDLVLGCSSVDEYLDKISNYDGVIETSAALGYRLWMKYYPKATFIIIHRTVINISKSCENLGLVPDWGFLYLQELMLSKMISDHRVPFFTFEGLDRVENRKRLCDITVSRFESYNDEIWANKNVQVDTKVRLDFLKVNANCFLNFHNDVARRVVYLENDNNV